MISESMEVSVILPTYNRANLLGRAVKSVLNQSYEKFELLIVDDGSTDNTNEVVRQFYDPRIRYIHCEQNGGAARARNKGIQEAKCSYIAFQDSDDVWKQDKLLKQVNIIKQVSNDTGIVYSEYFYHGLHGLEGICPDREIPMQQKQGNIFPELLTGNMIGTPTMLIKKECFDQVGMFNEKMNCLEDYELVLRVAKMYRVVLVPECLVEVYATEGSVTFNIEGYMTARCILAGLYKQELIKYGLFNDIVGEILNKAAIMGYLEKATAYLEAVMSK